MYYYNSMTHVYLLMYSASEWICLDLWRFINVLLIIIIIACTQTWAICPYTHEHHRRNHGLFVRIHRNSGLVNRGYSSASA